MKKPAQKRIKKYAGHFANGIISVLDLSGTFTLRDIHKNLKQLDDNDSLSQDLSAIADDVKAVMPILSNQVKRQASKKQPEVNLSVNG